MTECFVKKPLCLLATFVCALIAPATGHASNDIITLNMATSKMIQLPKPAGTVLIANPAAVSAILDQPQRLVLMPLQPTATRMTILDRQGAVMTEATIMVSPRREQAVIIDRHCTGTGGCPASSTLYCTDDECLDLGMGAPLAQNANNVPQPAPAQMPPTDQNFTPPPDVPLPGQEPLP